MFRRRQRQAEEMSLDQVLQASAIFSRDGWSKNSMILITTT